MIDVPNLPELEGRAPNLAARKWVTTQLGNLPGKYAPQMQQARNEAQAGLAGYGTYRFAKDNPTTVADESLNLQSTGTTGVRFRQAERKVEANHNARGTLHSSFARANIGTARQQLTEEARGQAMQYAAKINSILGRKSAEQADLVGELTQLYGADAAWLTENPFLTAAPQPNTEGPQGSTETTFWHGQAKPKMETLEARHPGVKLKPVQNPDGTWKVVSA